MSCLQHRVVFDDPERLSKSVVKLVSNSKPVFANTCILLPSPWQMLLRNSASNRLTGWHWVALSCNVLRHQKWWHFAIFLKKWSRTKFCKIFKKLPRTTIGKSCKRNEPDQNLQCLERKKNSWIPNLQQKWYGTTVWTICRAWPGTTIYKIWQWWSCQQIPMSRL